MVLKPRVRLVVLDFCSTSLLFGVPAATDVAIVIDILVAILLVMFAIPSWAYVIGVTVWLM